MTDRQPLPDAAALEAMTQPQLVALMMVLTAAIHLRQALDALPEGRRAAPADTDLSLTGDADGLSLVLSVTLPEVPAHG